MKLSKKLKVAVIGVGHMGRYHVQKLAQLDNVDLIGLCDVNPQAVQEFASQFNLQVYTDYQALVEQVDAVSIAVPTQYHYTTASYFLARGKHVLLEKPISANLEDAEKLISLANNNKAILQIGHLERFNPAHLALKNLVDKPLFIESHRISPFKPRCTDVDVVLDLMIHDIDLILDMVDSQITRVDANGAPVLTDKVDITNTRIAFDNGCVANITASRVSNKSERKLRIFQKDSYIHIDFNDKKLLHYKKGAGEMFPGIPNIQQETIEFQESDALQEEISSFINAIEQKRPPLVSGNDGKRALEVALQIKQALNVQLDKVTL